MDDPDNIRRFISQMKGQREQSDLATATAQPIPIPQHAQAANTSPRTNFADHDDDRRLSPEAIPYSSPYLSGLKAPQNTPKTAASSPRMTVGNTHNEDVAEALSDYVNAMDGRPLTESMWAPGSASYKPSRLRGQVSTGALTPIKAVEPNPAINDTFHRMSFKAADPDYDVAKNMAGDNVTPNLFSNAPPPSFGNTFSVSEDRNREDKVGDGKANREMSDDGFDPATHTDTSKRVELGTDRASKKDFETQADTDDATVRENDPPSTSKANIAPHLRAIRASSQNSDSRVRVPAPKKSESNPWEPSQAPHSPVPNPPTMGAEAKAAINPARAKPLQDKPVNEDLEHQTFFGAWPKLEERDRPAAKVRTVIINDLPRGSTASFVASLVYGGDVEDIHLRTSTAGHLSARIRFLDAGDCQKFYDETSNGIVYKADAKGRDLVLFVELAKDVDVVGGLLQSWIALGVTRCVRAVGVEAEWGMDGLVKIAERKGRKVERVVNGQTVGGARSVVFRFCRVEDAVQFKAALSRDEGWEHCNIHYATDPCAAASGVHLED